MARHIVITIHGIRTYGKWQERFKALIHRHDESIAYCAYTYGYFSVVAFLIPPIRWLVVRRFRKSLLQLCHDNRDARIDLVAHSFGTHIIAWAIVNLPAYLRPRIHTVILSGSVLRPSFPWGDLLTSGAVQRVVNDCGINDAVLVLNQLVVLFTGMAGRIGLAGLTSDRLLNRFFKGGHSLYFVDEAGVESDAFMERFWTPILIGESNVELLDERDTPSALAGVLRTLIQNTEPIKLLVYAAIMASPFIVYRHLYLEATAERYAAEEATSRATRAAQRAIEQRDVTLKTLEWAINESVSFPYDSAMLASDSPPLRMLLELVSRLRAAQFRGDILIAGNIGTFCYSISKSGKRIVPRESRQCHVGGTSREYAIGLGMRLAQSVRRLLLETIRPSDHITLSVVSYGMEKPLYCYPEGPRVNAAEMNAIGRLNNRVEITLIPEGGNFPPQVEQPCIRYVPTSEINITASNGH